MHQPGERPTPTISPQELAQRLAGCEVELVDVRSLEEYAAGHIPGARHLPLQELTERWRELDPSVTYALICRSGRRSAMAAHFLLSCGFVRVHNVDGGMLSWDGEVECLTPEELAEEANLRQQS